jgi:hypothetical protein
MREPPLGNDRDREMHEAVNQYSRTKSRKEVKQFASRTSDLGICGEEALWESL